MKSHCHNDWGWRTASFGKFFFSNYNKSRPWKRHRQKSIIVFENTFHFLAIFIKLIHWWYSISKGERSKINQNKIIDLVPLPTVYAFQFGLPMIHVCDCTQQPQHIWIICTYNVRDIEVMYIIPYHTSRHNESLRPCTHVVTRLDAVHAFLSDKYLKSKPK